MRAHGAGRTVWTPIAVVMTLLAGAIEGLASNGLDAGTRQTALGTIEEPFASSGLRFAEGPLAQIWQHIKVLTDIARLALCAAQEAFCSPAERKVRNIVAEAQTLDGLARAGFINRAINLAIKPTIDPFVWRSPLEIMSLGAGDCEEKVLRATGGRRREACDCARHGREPRPCDRCCPDQYRLVSAGQSLANVNPGLRIVVGRAALHARRAWSETVLASTDRFGWARACSPLHARSKRS